MTLTDKVCYTKTCFIFGTFTTKHCKNAPISFDMSVSTVCLSCPHITIYEWHNRFSLHLTLYSLTKQCPNFPLSVSTKQQLFTLWTQIALAASVDASEATQQNTPEANNISHKQFRKKWNTFYTQYLICRSYGFEHNLGEPARIVI